MKEKKIERIEEEKKREEEGLKSRRSKIRD